MQTPLKPALKSPALKSWMAIPAIAIAAVAISAPLSGVHAQSQDDEARTEATLTSYAQFQYATLTGTTNTLNVTMLPVVTAKGVVYKNLTLAVNVDANGNITVAPGSPTITAAPTTMASSFKDGPYVGPSTVNSGTNLITVSGPGVVVGGTTVWSLTASPNASTCTYPASATWWVGPPSSTNNPLYIRLQKAGITSTAFSYGTIGSASAADCTDSDYWGRGTLVGLSQTGNQLTISSFSTFGTIDSGHALDQITYTYK
jgi:hypothetical protein